MKRFDQARVNGGSTYDSVSLNYTILGQISQEKQASTRSKRVSWTFELSEELAKLWYTISVEKGVAPFGRSAEEEIAGEIIPRGHAVFGGCSTSALFQQAKGSGTTTRVKLDSLLASRRPALEAVSEERSQQEVGERSHLLSPDHGSNEPIDVDRTSEESIQESRINSAIDLLLARSAGGLHTEEPATSGRTEGAIDIPMGGASSDASSPPFPDSF